MSRHDEPELRALEQRDDDEAYETWRAEHEWALRWKAAAKRYRQQVRELRGRLRDAEARRG